MKKKIVIFILLTLITCFLLYGYYSKKNFTSDKNEISVNKPVKDWIPTSESKTVEFLELSPIRKKKYSLFNYEYFNDNYTGQSVSDELKKTIKVSMEPTEIVYNHTTESKKVDNERCTVVYKLKIQNISNETVKVYAAFIIPNELYSTIIHSNDKIGDLHTEIIIPPGLDLTITQGVIMTHFDKLTNTERKLYNEQINDLNAIIILNESKEILFKIDDTKITELR